MKKLISLVLVLIMALTFCACNKMPDTQSALSGVEKGQPLLPNSNEIDTSTDTTSSETIKPSTSDKTPQTDTTSPNSVPSNTSRVESSETNSDVSTDSKPQQPEIDDPNTITAPNGDKIYIELQKGEQPSVMVKVNGKEIYSYSNFAKYTDQYDFDKDFTNNVIDEYSDEEILWAYKFNWGVVYAAPYEDQIIYVAGAKHEHEKKTYGTYQYYHLALEMDLIDYKISEYTGEKYYWENLPLAQSFTEYFYKTEDYTIIEIPDWVEAGYDFQEYYEWYNLNVRKGLGSFYELYIGEEKTALLFLSAAEGIYKIQEFGWDSIKTIWVSQGNPHLNAEFR